MFPINTVPVRYPPVATWTLIAINCVVFLFETSLSEPQLEDLLSQFALIPARYADATDLSDYLPFATTHVLFNPGSTIPALGASGAIAGVIGANMRLFPAARVIVLVPIIFIPLFFAVPAVVFAGLWFLMQVLQATTELFLPTGGGSIAWWAHIGGFTAGFILASPLRHSRRPAWPRYDDQGILGLDLTGR